VSRFQRNDTPRWHREIPGTRWLRADLHVHTLDDHFSGNFRFPPGISGNAADLATQTAYARSLLKATIANGIQVLGLTPHSVRAGDSDDTSATWRIVEVWNNDSDDDGVPFREKIYAVYPGFEPNLADGAEGLHLQFLFDPEIGREQYLAAFAEVMGALPPWDGGSLRISTNRAENAFGSLRTLRERLGKTWDYLCLAPHAFGGRGLFSLKSQVLQWFAHDAICGLELGDDSLPDDELRRKPYLADGLKKYRHALYHSSDAYSVAEIGKRFTLLKLGSPRIESLRQSLLAADSRLRIAYRPDAQGRLVVAQGLPDPAAGDRPWLQGIAVKGGTSFFGGQDAASNSPVTSVFQFSPDFTCVIGGRMSGKSTLLDGIRLWFGFDLPTDAAERKDVDGRARNRFLSGSPEIQAEVRGPIPLTSPPRERWPATIYTQRELRSAVHDQETRRQLLYRLIPSLKATLVSRDAELKELDGQLAELVDDVDQCRQTMEAAKEDESRATTARAALQRFAEAGISLLSQAQEDQGRLRRLEESLQRIAGLGTDLAAESQTVNADDIVSQVLRGVLEPPQDVIGFRRLTRRLRATVRYLTRIVRRLQALTTAGQAVAATEVGTLHARVQQALIAAGGTSEEINQFDALTRTAAGYEESHARYQAAKQAYRNSLRQFGQVRRRRSQLIVEQRQEMEQVVATVAQRFGGRISIQRQTRGASEPLERWLVAFREGGITRWWNNTKATGISVTPDVLRMALRTQQLQTIEMSTQVARTLSGAMTPRRQLELAALPGEDRYEIELQVDESRATYRTIDRLSGGAQVSVLLSLVMETDESSPLVIDQPEDEIDKAYLFEVLLPALRRLKGRRQVIFATHDANLVVNGDADHVIVLRADSDRGWVAETGTIDQPRVRDAIVETLDGGREAFELRQAKYGF